MNDPASHTHAAEVDLVLASTSPYRRQLLERLQLRFRTLAPSVDEIPHPDEAPIALARRLANAKAHSVARTCPDALVIGSDQVAQIEDRALGKPASGEAARAQLAAASGKAVQFHTALCLVDTRGQMWHEQCALDTTRVTFRALTTDEIARYVAIEQPLDCAGSFKVEGFGITLLERVDSADPSALIGLPLIALARLLRAAGLALP